MDYIAPSPTRAADDAFLAWAALRKAEAADPALRDNPHWTMLMQDAWERFWIEFGKLPG